MRSAAMNKRCNADDPLLLEYLDREWDVPAHSDRKHFEGPLRRTGRFELVASAEKAGRSERVNSELISADPR
jgi:hypothetical protein